MNLLPMSRVLVDAPDHLSFALVRNNVIMTTNGKIAIRRRLEGAVAKDGAYQFGASGGIVPVMPPVSKNRRNEHYPDIEIYRPSADLPRFEQVLFTETIQKLTFFVRGLCDQCENDGDGHYKREPVIVICGKNKIIYNDFNTGEFCESPFLALEHEIRLDAKSFLIALQEAMTHSSQLGNIRMIQQLMTGTPEQAMPVIIGHDFDNCVILAPRLRNCSYND